MRKRMKNYYVRTRRGKRRAKRRFFVILGLLLAVLGAGAYFLAAALNSPADAPDAGGQTVIAAPSAAPAETPSEEPAATLAAELAPAAGEGTSPSDIGLTTGVMADGAETQVYRRGEPIVFGSGGGYTALPGVIGFRGNNYRDAAGWGSAEIADATLELVNTKITGDTGSMNGIGWTGQPLIVEWPAQTRAQMTTLAEEYRGKDGFVEVIYASLTGYVYFMDLETGEKTRSPIKTGTVSGTPSLDPRGYPILYVGLGGGTSGRNMYIRAYSLIDGEKLMQAGAAEKDPFAYASGQSYNASPLIDGATDTLIYPGGNGVVYVCDLNTGYNEQTGELTMDKEPNKVKYRYTSPQNEAAGSGGGRWGIDASPVAWRNYLMFPDSAGVLQCVDLSTMQPVYARNLGGESDATPVLEEAPADQAIYLYTGSAYDGTGQGAACARKLNGLTGEVVWETPFTVRSDGGASGGIYATPVLGRAGSALEGLVVYSVTGEVTGEAVTSRLVALNKADGSEAWSYDMQTDAWSPSSPAPVYASDGGAYIVQCDGAGDVALIDGETGREAAKLNVGTGERFEASPAVFGNMIIVGSRNKHIFFITIK